MALATFAVQDTAGNPNLSLAATGVTNAVGTTNAPPVFSSPTASRSVAENSAAGTNVGAPVTATETDSGDTLTYTLEGTDAAAFDIVSTSGQIRTRPGVTYDHEAQVELLRHRQGRRRQRWHRHHRGDDHGHGRGIEPPGRRCGRARPSTVDLRKHHEPVG